MNPPAPWVPGCEAPLLLFQFSSVLSVWFLNLSVFGVWRSSVKMVWRSSLGLRVLECRPKSVAFPPSRRGAGSGTPPGQPWKIIKFQASLQALQSHENLSQGDPKPQKSTLKSSEFQPPWKVDYCNTSYTKCVFLEPQTSRFRAQNRSKKKPWKQT